MGRNITPSSKCGVCPGYPQASTIVHRFGLVNYLKRRGILEAKKTGGTLGFDLTPVAPSYWELAAASSPDDDL
jgi:hypothetical protein